MVGEAKQNKKLVKNMVILKPVWAFVETKIFEELIQPSVRFGKASSLGGEGVFFHLPKC
jgi:hypothetical protein